jgi:hypothetical protein
MKIQFHEGDRTVDPIVIWIIVGVFADPGEISLVEMFLKEGESVFQDGRRVVFVEGEEEHYDFLALCGGEEGDGTAL